MGILYIVSTPIGNLEDITIRAIKTLFSVDYLACEDTRITGQLLSSLKLKIQSEKLRIEGLNIDNIPKLISYYDEIEFKRVPEIIEFLNNDKNVALVSDSGTPLISDPGFKLVSECIKRNIKIISIPGPSSIITSLTLSGLPLNDFRFIGFLPPKKNSRLKLLENILSGIRPHKNKYTIIAFESSHRLKESLKDIMCIYGDIKIVICRELTKIYEDIWRGNISQALEINEKFKGELIILINLS